MAEKDFFISYNRADRKWAEWIAYELEEAGYTTVIQAWDFRPGGNFVLDMHRAAAEAERTVAVLSPDYLSSLFTQPEWAAAFAQDPTGEKGLLLPVRVRECKLEGLLLQIVYVDLVGGDEAEAKDRLLGGVKRERAKPATSPQFPGAKTAERSVAEKPNFPGALPPVWNVPHRENPHFVGRDELLDQIHQTLSAGQAAAIHGLGGVGKSQLAAHHAHRHKSDYQIVWWIKAEAPATLAGDYEALATALDLPEKDAREQPVIVEAVRRWLGQHPGWLLIFDNARDAKEVRDYLPPGRAGHALITSRDPNWRGVASPLEVRTLEREDAARFLLERTGQRDESNQTAARALAEELGDLPLALEQAGAYIEETGAKLIDYAELFQARRRELQQEERPPAGYPDTVATTWLLSFRQAEHEAPAAAELLRLCAFLAPDDVPLSMLRDGAKHLPAALAAAVTDQLACNRTIAALRRYSLLTRQDDSLSAHRLVQLVTRDRLSEDERKQWVAAAISLVNQAFPEDSDDVRTWPVCVRLLPHALVATEAGEALQAAPEATAQLIYQIGGYLQGRAQYGEAKQAIERALRIDEAIFGPDHPELAGGLNNLGHVLRDLGDSAGAQDCYERALRIGETAFGPDDPRVATIVNNLSLVLMDLGDFAGARAGCERALRIDEAAFGPDHPEVAKDVNNLGRVIQNLGDLAGARDCFERALRIFEVHLGKEHPNVASLINNLGTVLHDLDDLAGARDCFERALRIDEVAYGPDHPKVAIDVNNLAGALKDLGDLAGARNCAARALQICLDSLGADHPKTLLARKNLQSLG